MKVLSRRPPAGRPPENRRARLYLLSPPSLESREGHPSIRRAMRERDMRSLLQAAPREAHSSHQAERPTADAVPAGSRAGLGPGRRTSQRRSAKDPYACSGRTPSPLPLALHLARTPRTRHSLARLLPPFSVFLPRLAHHVCKDLHRQRPARGQGHAHRSSAAALHCCCCSCLRPAARRSDLRLCALSLGRRRARSPRPQTATPSSD